MATASESQGLKIAVAAFVSLTVILAVTSYAFYSMYDKAAAEAAEANQQASQKAKAASDALNQWNELRDKAGYPNLTDADALNTAITKDEQAIVAEVAATAQEIRQRIAQVQAAGASSTELERLITQADELVAAFTDEPNRTFAAMLKRQSELLRNRANLLAALAVDNLTLQRNLASVNMVNQERHEVALAELEQALEDLRNEHETHETARQELLARLDQLQSTNAEQATQVAELDRQLRDAQMDAERTREDLMVQLQYWRTQAEMEQDVLSDVPDGQITYVDYGREEVRTNLTRRMGFRPMMTLTVFDRDALVGGTERPKAVVQLQAVGENTSLARVVDITDRSNPIRVGDQLHSVSVQAGEPQRFALIGKIDMNRDGRDDRENLIRLIEANGGIIDYDLPPPGVGTGEQGELNARIAWYVIDDRPAFRDPHAADRQEIAEDFTQFLEVRTQAIRRAQQLGIRPMPLQRLLPYLGYRFDMKTPGWVEAIDESALQDLIMPGGLTAPRPNGDDNGEAQPTTRPNNNNNRFNNNRFGRP